MKICPTCLERYDDEQDYCPDDGQQLRHIHTEEDKLVGEVLDGRWLIEETIGEGGMGAVYCGHQTSVKRKVAVKTLRRGLADTQEYVERFFREANVASTLNHPHCVTIYDFGQSEKDHVLYLAMEYLDGRSLADVLRDDMVTLEQALTIGAQICAALSAAHDINVVHRDLKPDNVFLVDVAGGTGEVFVKVLDFGIAKILGDDDEGDEKVTQTGQIFGTPAYMSPEQCHSADVDRRSDLYSLGVILYELVSGDPPFGGQTPLKTLLAHVSAEAEPPSQRGIDVPDGVEAIIMCLLEKDPDDRFQGANEVRQRLEELLDELDDEVLETVPGYSQGLGDEDSSQTVLFEDVGADDGDQLVDLGELESAVTAEFDDTESGDNNQTARWQDKASTGWGESLSDAAADTQESADQTLLEPPSSLGEEAHEDAAGPDISDADDAEDGDQRRPMLMMAAGGVVLGALALFVALDTAPDTARQRGEKAVAQKPSPSEAPTDPTEPSDVIEPLQQSVAGAWRQAHGAQQGKARGAGLASTARSVVETQRPRAAKRQPSERPHKTAKPSTKTEKKKGPGPMLPVLTQEGVRRIIASHNEEITACFEKGLLRDPDFSGRVRVRTVVSGDGAVANADILESTVDAADVESCILESVRSWTFPEPADGRVKILTTPFEYQAPAVDKKPADEEAVVDKKSADKGESVDEN